MTGVRPITVLYPCDAGKAAWQRKWYEHTVFAGHEFVCHGAATASLVWRAHILVDYFINHRNPKHGGWASHGLLLSRLGLPVSALHGKVLLHLDDEYGARTKLGSLPRSPAPSVYCELYANFSFVFRNYWSDSWSAAVDGPRGLVNCSAARCADAPPLRVEWVPLGWSANWQPRFGLAVPRGTQRQTIVGFYGNEKAKMHRGAAIEKFKRDANVTVSRVLGKDGFGKGNVSQYVERMLDTQLCLQVAGLSTECYRMYEALDSGCIPILIDELGGTTTAREQYRFLLDLESARAAPFPYARTSAGVRAELARLVAQPSALDKLQRDTHAWWKRKLGSIIAHVIEVARANADECVPRAAGGGGGGGGQGGRAVRAGRSGVHSHGTGGESAAHRAPRHGHRRLRESDKRLLTGGARGQHLLTGGTRGRRLLGGGLHRAAAGPRLLAHFTFHNSNSTKGVSAVNYATLCSQLEVFDAGFDMFERIDAVVDVNPSNAYIRALRRWSPRGAGGCGCGDSCGDGDGDGGGGAATATRVNVYVHVHANLSHPFLLAWAHREHVARSLERYDWFFYTEADTHVKAVGMRLHYEIAPRLWAQRKLLLGFLRVSNDSANRQFYSDLRRSAPRSALLSVDGLGTFLRPQQSYSAVWTYPRQIVRQWMADDPDEFFYRARSFKQLRERASWGWRSTSHEIVVCVATPQGHTAADTHVVHVGKSGVHFARVRGHNTLPVEQLVGQEAA